MDENRFAPPTTDVTEPDTPIVVSHELAKRDQRAIGFMIDLLITYPLMLLLKILPSALGIFVLFDVKVDLFMIPNLLAWLVTLFIYYLVCEGIWFRTVGKLVTGTHVVQSSGQDPTFSRILIRTITRYIPLEFLTYLDSKRPRGWHDRWSDTSVVNKISDNDLAG